MNERKNILILIPCSRVFYSCCVLILIRYEYNINAHFIFLNGKSEVLS
jgi:hypothetical protein